MKEGRRRNIISIFMIITLIITIWATQFYYCIHILKNGQEEEEVMITAAQ